MAPGIPPVTVSAQPPAPGRIVGLYAAAALIDEPRSVVGGVEVPVDTAGGHGLWLTPARRVRPERRATRAARSSSSPALRHGPRSSAIWSA